MVQSSTLKQEFIGAIQLSWSRGVQSLHISGDFNLVFRQTLYIPNFVAGDLDELI